MIKLTHALSMTRAALLAAVVLSARPAFAATSITSYNEGDLFIGFRQNGVTNTLTVDLGSILKFIPTALGGTWSGSTFQVQFGVIPGTSTAVFSLAPDLASANLFGSSWASDPGDGSGVHWGLAGVTSTTTDNTPVNGWSKGSVFLSKAETTNGVQSSPFGSIALSTAATNIVSFANGTSGGAYKSENSTTNSSVAYLGAGSDSNNWSARLGGTPGASGSFGASGSLSIEQSGGPAGGVLDLYVRKGPGATGASTVYLGSFELDSSGQLTYANASFFAAPEPTSVALVAFGGLAFGMIRRRPRQNSAMTA